MKISSVTPGGQRIAHEPDSLLNADLREAARVEANQWIKRLRLVRYGSETMRERFKYRSDSLWWFTELYLHKMRRLEVGVETILALDAARDAGAARLIVETDDPVRREAAQAFGRARGVAIEISGATRTRRSTRIPSALIALTARLSRLRPGRFTPPARRPAIVAFVHTAFWRAADPQQESYIGPVLDALAHTGSAEDLFFVGVGPRRNFRARRWWDPVTPAAGGALPIERIAPARALRGSFALWRQRHDLARAITAGDDIRAAGLVRGCNLWTILERELEAVALVQWPWSARAMDEAGATMDALEPRTILTYAEAGGWGRALVLEARRRGIKSAGLQHGFIYRHWLNYLHEADEMATGGDGGFPHPDLTLLYDCYAGEHLATQGHLPEHTLSVTGSARLEDLQQRLAALSGERDAIRERLGIRTGEHVGVLAAKFTEIQNELPAVAAAAAALPGFRLIIKTHPAETADVYMPFVKDLPMISVVSAGADLAELLAIADVILTKNSTVAIDGLVLQIPALVVGLPNNLSPFVTEGVMLGADGPEKIRQGLEALLYDRQIREAVRVRASAFARRYGLAPVPGSAARAAEQIRGLTRPRGDEDLS